MSPNICVDAFCFENIEYQLCPTTQQVESYVGASFFCPKASSSTKWSDLLASKTFEELLPEEKTFVLAHVDSKQEYAEIRSTLLAVKKAADSGDLIQPEVQVKDNLIALMEKKRDRGAWFTLNGLMGFLFPTDVVFYRKPAFQFGSLAMLLLVVFIRQAH